MYANKTVIISKIVPTSKVRFLANTPHSQVHHNTPFLISFAEHSE